ncbi:hypothetical protein ACN6LL_001198 [Streptomyces violaceoruber]
MRIKNAIRTLCAAAALALFGIVGTTGTASAAASTVYYVEFHGAQGKLDTNPGNGYASWIWAWNPNDYDMYIEWQYYGASGDKPSDYLHISPYGGTTGGNDTEDIWRIRLCYTSDDLQGYSHKYCSSWT